MTYQLVAQQFVSPATLARWNITSESTLNNFCYLTVKKTNNYWELMCNNDLPASSTTVCESCDTGSVKHHIRVHTE